MEEKDCNSEHPRWWSRWWRGKVVQFESAPGQSDLFGGATYRAGRPCGKCSAMPTSGSIFSDGCSEPRTVRPSAHRSLLQRPRYDESHPRTRCGRVKEGLLIGRSSSGNAGGFHANPETELGGTDTARRRIEVPVSSSLYVCTLGLSSP